MLAEPEGKKSKPFRLTRTAIELESKREVLDAVPRRWFVVGTPSEGLRRYPYTTNRSCVEYPEGKR